MPKGVIRKLDPSNPESIDHPSHRQKWLELVKALATALADRDFEAQRKRGQHDRGSRGDVRKILDRPPKR